MAKKIMIVDDAITMRQLVAATLKSAGYEVIDARDGVDALKKLQGQRLNLIISDVNMPNMDGIELVQKVKADPRQKFTPIIMLTTESQQDKKEQGRKAGAKAWIVKPFKPDDLLNVVKKIIG